ncbi:MAG: FkbM family methyltransferase [Sphingomicrobium sp.]
MSPLKILLLWMSYSLRGILGLRRFIAVTPPFMKTQRLYDRRTRSWLTFQIRDADDWIQIEHIFLNEEFDLTPTARLPQIERHYQHMLEGGVEPLIVDLGSNIGLVSAYFALTYPRAKIVSVEPDEGNCRLARQNLPAQSELLEAAISSRDGAGKLNDTGRNCGFQVEKTNDGDVRLITVPSILASTPGVPFLIKIDIEGFEEDLFADNVDWIDQFPVLLIELHDWMLPGRRVTSNFIKAIAARDREIMHFDGYLVSLSSRL